MHYDGTDNFSCLWVSDYTMAFATTVPSAWNSILSPTSIYLANPIPYLPSLNVMASFSDFLILSVVTPLKIFHTSPIAHLNCLLLFICMSLSRL